MACTTLFGCYLKPIRPSRCAAAEGSARAAESTAWFAKKYGEVVHYSAALAYALRSLLPAAAAGVPPPLSPSGASPCTSAEATLA